MEKLGWTGRCEVRHQMLVGRKQKLDFFDEKEKVCFRFLPKTPPSFAGMGRARMGTRPGSKTRSWRKARSKINHISDNTQAYILASLQDFWEVWLGSKNWFLLGSSKARIIPKACLALTYFSNYPTQAKAHVSFQKWLEARKMLSPFQLQAWVTWTRNWMIPFMRSSIFCSNLIFLDEPRSGGCPSAHQPIGPSAAHRLLAHGSQDLIVRLFLRQLFRFYFIFTVSLRKRIKRNLCLNLKSDFFFFYTWGQFLSWHFYFMRLSNSSAERNAGR